MIYKMLSSKLRGIWNDRTRLSPDRWPEQAKRSILSQLVDPQIGGRLLIGLGCGKTSLARAAADILSQGSFIDIPLGCGEERLSVV